MVLCSCLPLLRSLFLAGALVISCAASRLEEATLTAQPVHFHGRRSEKLRKLYAAETPEPITLRVCNAYAFGSAVDVLKGEAPHFTQKLTAKTGPLPFKQCFDLPNAQLQPGEKLEFMVGGDLHLGSFAVTHLPKGKVLQLVISRHDELTTAAAFSSHVFTEQYNPQIAVVDTYIGPSRAKLTVHRDSDDKTEEGVNYQRVVSVEPGSYTWSLRDSLANHKEQASGIAQVHLNARSWGEYTAVRTGIKAYHGPSFDEGLIIFPGGEEVSTRWRSSAGSTGCCGAVMAAVVSLAVVWTRWAD